MQTTQADTLIWGFGDAYMSDVYVELESWGGEGGHPTQASGRHGSHIPRAYMAIAPGMPPNRIIPGVPTVIITTTEVIKGHSVGGQSIIAARLSVQRDLTQHGGAPERSSSSSSSSTGRSRSRSRIRSRSKRRGEGRLRHSAGTGYYRTDRA